MKTLLLHRALLSLAEESTSTKAVLVLNAAFTRSVKAVDMDLASKAVGLSLRIEGALNSCQFQAVID